MRHRAARRAIRRRRVLFALALVALASAVGGFAVAAQDRRDGGRAAEPAPRLVVVIEDGHRLLSAPASRVARWPARTTARWLRRVPAGREITRGRTTFELATDATTLRRRVEAATRAGGGSVRVPEHAIASRIRLGVVKQALRNNCETAALSMLLAAHGVHAGQLALQRALPRSGPADPQRGAGLPLWGDPDRGFVGRVTGGGTDGGFGVYEPPIVALAARQKIRIGSLGHRSSAVYRALLAGRPVLAWVALSDGPFMTWRTPAGRQITGNFGEHTVLLTGLAGSSVSVNDPLSGQRLTWSRSYFEQLWKRLGQRAVA